MVEGIARTGNVVNTCVSVMLSELGLSHSKHVYCFEIIRSVREAFFFLRIERMLVVAMRMLCLTTGPALRLTYPASSKIKANLNIGLVRGIGSNFRLKHRLRHGRLCKYVKDSCVVMYLKGAEITSDHCASVLHKVKSWLLEATEQDKNKTPNENNGDI